MYPIGRLAVARFYLLLSNSLQSLIFQQDKNGRMEMHWKESNNSNQFLKNPNLPKVSSSIYNRWFTKNVPSIWKLKRDHKKVIANLELNCLTFPFCLILLNKYFIKTVILFRVEQNDICFNRIGFHIKEATLLISTLSAADLHLAKNCKLLTRSVQVKVWNLCSS